MARDSHERIRSDRRIRTKRLRTNKRREFLYREKQYLLHLQFQPNMGDQCSDRHSPCLRKSRLFEGLSSFQRLGYFRRESKQRLVREHNWKSQRQLPDQTMTPTIKAKETFGHIKSLFSFITDLIPPANSLVTPHSFFQTRVYPTRQLIYQTTHSTCKYNRIKNQFYRR